ncbi:MAG: hypothetical protein Fur0015_14160 [Ignavibacteriales bacterium]
MEKIGSKIKFLKVYLVKEEEEYFFDNDLNFTSPPDKEAVLRAIEQKEYNFIISEIKKTEKIYDEIISWKDCIDDWGIDYNKNKEGE